MDSLQKLIHLLEVGGGMRYVRIAIAVLLLFGLGAIYDWRGYRNMATQEAMDTAQLARNISKGSYSTLFVRPLSMHLLQSVSVEKQGVLSLGQNTGDPAHLKGPHPDLANPPVYPALLAGLMTVPGLFRYDVDVDASHPFWSIPRGRIVEGEEGSRQFWWYEPDFIIAVFNQVLFLIVIGLTFLLARRLFDRNVAWVAALLLLGSELLWRFSVSGLSTMLLMVIALLLLWCVVLLEEETREPKWGQSGLLVLAAFAGVLVGLGGLTRYSFCWMILPLVLFIVLFTGRQRAALVLVAFVAFAVVVSPWLYWTYSKCGAPFGTASYTLLEATSTFPGHSLQRSLEPNLEGLPRLFINAFKEKLLPNTRAILTNDLPRIGGTWVSAFFLVGLMVNFRSPTAKRLRYFVVASLVLLVLVQALGRTQLSEDSPEINSENLLILLAPIVVVYGVSLFYLLFEQLQLPFRELRYIVLGLFGTIVCLPLILQLLSHKSNPIAFPPYYPPHIQRNARFVNDDELMMSDIPWAVAWYGQTQCAWLTPRLETDFFHIHDYWKPIQEVFLSQGFLNERFATQLFSGEDQRWGSLLMRAVYSPSAQGTNWPKLVNLPVLQGEGQALFPLGYWQRGFPEEFVLTFRQSPPK